MDEQQPADLKAQPAIFHATIEIKRAATGKTETYQLTGTALPPEDPPAEQKEP